MSGSPPREWGQLPVDRVPYLSVRFTPTRVGTAKSPPTPRMPLSVHPHASGDSPPSTSMSIRTSGSPPREWGQRSLRLLWPVSHRFTPTRVGTAPTESHSTSASMVREWGQQESVTPWQAEGRFTPTRVGTASTPARIRSRRRVHPHASGDSKHTGAYSQPSSGSPPREWGQLSGRLDWTPEERFTPTRVGTALTFWRLTMCVGVHPHASGDSGSGVSLARPILGSPPREWGQLYVVRPVDVSQRFTPTRVGTAWDTGPR